MKKYSTASLASLAVIVLGVLTFSAGGAEWGTINGGFLVFMTGFMAIAIFAVIAGMPE